MILGILIVLFLLLFTLVLYSCLRISTPQDRTLDDQQQEEYLRNYHLKKTHR